MPRTLPIALAATAAAGAIAAPAQAAVTRTTLSAASADNVVGSSQLAVGAAPDGSVAAAFLKKVGGVDHVFLATGTGGNLGAPTQVDTGLASASGPPVVAAASGGKAVVVFPNGGAGTEKLYAVAVPSAGAPAGAPTTVDGNALGWKGLQLAVAGNGNGYLTAYEGLHLHAFKVSGAATFAQVGAPANTTLNQDLTHQANSGDQTGAHLAVTPDGASATIAWSEDSAAPGAPATWVRTIKGTATTDIGTAASPNIPSLDGKLAADGANDMTWVGIGGGLSYVAFREFFTYGAQNIPRLIMRSFDGTTFGAARVIDGIGAVPANGGAEVPRFSMNAAGQGISADYRQLTFSTEFATKATGGDWSTGALVPGFPTPLSAGRATTALTESGVGLVAATNEATAGQATELGRITGGTADGSQVTLSDPGAGKVAIASDAATGSDFALVALRQGAAATSQVIAAKVDLPPTPSQTPAPTPTPAPGGSGGATRIVPTFTALKLSSTTIRRANKKPVVLAAGAKGPYLEVGTDRAARIVVVAERALPGRRTAKGTCARPGKGASGKPCTRYVAAGAALILDRPAGTTRIRFTGRLGGKLLRAGKYRLGVTAADAATGGLSKIRYLPVTLR